MTFTFNVRGKQKTTIMKNTLFLIILSLLIGGTETIAQKKKQPEKQNKKINGAKLHFAKMEANALKENYRGVETENGKVENLFPIHSTGVSTKPIENAANSFLESLTSKQKNRTLFDIDDHEWRKWCNVDNGIYDRQGVSLKEMTGDQKRMAFLLMQSSLSAKGLQLSKDIMKTDQTLRELNNGSTDFDEELYFFTIMGTPSQTEPWGWQIDGHHLVINYFILGDQIVMSPVFMGGEPILTTTGKYKGNSLFQDEQNIGLQFMQALTKEQQQEAIIKETKKRNDAQTEANKDNVTLNYQGLKASKLSNEKKKELLNLAFEYVRNIKDKHSQVKMVELETHIDNTWFSWIGETTNDAVFYYRIHSPVILIEFDHQGAVGVHSSERGPTRNHIHTVVRTPNGNDYGKNLLHQHKEKHHKH